MKSIIIRSVTLSILLFGIPSAFGQTISDEARRHFDRGTAAVEMAKSPTDYDVAIKEFQQAISLAPEWADAYFNLGKVQEQAEKFGDAIASLRQYLRLAPNAADADEVKSLINRIEFKAEQVLSIPDIIDVLVDFSNPQGWKYSATVKTGNRECRQTWQELRFGREGSDTVRALKATTRASLSTMQAEQNYYPMRDYYQTLKVTDSILKYVTTINLCDESANRREGGCDSVMENEVVVVSKRLVKVSQRVLRGGSGAGVANGDRFSCTFQKM